MSSPLPKHNKKDFNEFTVLNEKIIQLTDNHNNFENKYSEYIIDINKLKIKLELHDKYIDNIKDKINIINYDIKDMQYVLDSYDSKIRDNKYLCDDEHENINSKLNNIKHNLKKICNFNDTNLDKIKCVDELKIDLKKIQQTMLFNHLIIIIFIFLKVLLLASEIYYM